MPPVAPMRRTERGESFAIGAVMVVTLRMLLCYRWKICDVKHKSPRRVVHICMLRRASSKVSIACLGSFRETCKKFMRVRVVILFFFSCWNIKEAFRGTRNLLSRANSWSPLSANPSARCEPWFTGLRRRELSEAGWIQFHSHHTITTPPSNTTFHKYS